MNTGQIVLLLYALLILLGGLMGYWAGSRASLTAGTASGAVLLAAVVVSLFDRVAGLTVGAVVSLLLCVMFATRLARTRKLVPAGLLLTASVIALLILGLSALRADSS